MQEVMACGFSLSVAFGLVWCVICMVLHKGLSAAWSRAGLALPCSVLVPVLPGVTWLPALAAVGSRDVQPPSLAAELWHPWVAGQPPLLPLAAWLMIDRVLMPRGHAGPVQQRSCLLSWLQDPLSEKGTCHPVPITGRVNVNGWAGNEQ